MIHITDPQTGFLRPFTGSASRSLKEQGNKEDDSSSRDDALAHWREDPGPIGQAIREKKYDILLKAIRRVREQRDKDNGQDPKVTRRVHGPKGRGVLA